MKILILADGTSTHTMKWVQNLTADGIEIFLFSLTAVDYKKFDNIKFASLGLESQKTNTDKNDKSKIRYLKAVRLINNILNEFKPDILHSHYATSYGLLGVLTRFHPLITSVWGSDVYYFPRKSFVHKFILRYNLSHADVILSTSEAMASETKLYTRKAISVTPFGISTSYFYPKKVYSCFPEDSIVIGTIKSLDRIYGIEYLIKAFILLREKYSNIKLLLVGGYSKDNEDYVAYLKNLVSENKIEKDTVFSGRIPHDKVADFHNMLDISVYVSIRESFGVSVLESQACAKPVIVSNTGGLPEVVKNNETGFIVNPENEQETAAAIEKLIVNKPLRLHLGENARKWVVEKFDEKVVTKKMISIYRGVLDKSV